MALFADIDRRQVIDATWVSLRWLSATLKVLFVSLGSIVAVIFASLIISIIQFQLRLSEARTQNGNITLESVALIADYQDYISERYKSLRRNAEALERRRIDYQNQYSSTAQLISNLCSTLNPDKAAACGQRLLTVVSDRNNQVDAVIAEYQPENASPNASVVALANKLKQIISRVQSAESDFRSTQMSVRSQCTILTRFVSDQFSNTSLLGVTPELRMTISVQCREGDGSIGEPTTMQLQSVQSVTPGTGPASIEVRGEDAQGTNVSGVNRILLSELVFYYRFYDWLTSFMGDNLRQFILSPPEFIVILLVIATGTLGSFLFNSYVMFVAKSRDQFPTFFAILLRATLSVMCALVIYILSRTGFVAITDGVQRTNEAVISPFVIAFISVSAGLLAERALERIRAIGLNALKAPQRNDEPEQPNPQTSSS